MRVKEGRRATWEGLDGGKLGDNVIKSYPQKEKKLCFFIYVYLK